MSEDNLRWKMPALFKGISPIDAYNEIERIKTRHSGEITAKILLSESRNHKCVFHSYFNWNDEDAAEKFRLRQARDLLQNIQLHIIADGQPKTIRVFEVTKTDGNGKGVYKNIETLTPNDIEYIAVQALRALQTYRDKLSIYRQFESVIKHLDDAIIELNLLEVEQ